MGSTRVAAAFLAVLTLLLLKASPAAALTITWNGTVTAVPEAGNGAADVYDTIAVGAPVQLVVSYDPASLGGSVNPPGYGTWVTNTGTFALDVDGHTLTTSTVRLVVGYYDDNYGSGPIAMIPDQLQVMTTTFLCGSGEAPTPGPFNPDPTFCPGVTGLNTDLQFIATGNSPDGTQTTGLPPTTAADVMLFSPFTLGIRMHGFDDTAQCSVAVCDYYAGLLDASLGVPVVTSVPEPGLATLISLGVLGGALRRRSRRPGPRAAGGPEAGGRAEQGSPGHRRSQAAGGPQRRSSSYTP